MKELYFKITVISKNDVPFTLEQMRDNPTFEMYIAECSERLITVMYTPADGLVLDVFIDTLIEVIKKEYNAIKVERLETIKQIN